MFFAVLYSNLHHNLRHLLWRRERQFLGWHCQQPDKRCELARLELVDLGTLRLAKTGKGYPRLAGSYRIVACAKGEEGFAKYCMRQQ